jgi:hypothetical protein
MALTHAAGADMPLHIRLRSIHKFDSENITSN